MIIALLKAASICLVLAGTETLHGIARSLLLAPRIGHAQAKRISIVSGSILAFAVCHLLVPWLGLDGPGQLMALGICFSAFMAAFDITLARLVLHQQWRQIIDDVNPMKGNLLTLGVLLLAFMPLLTRYSRGLPS